MAGYFQLINLVTGEADSFNHIDELMCAAFDEQVDPDKYLIDWYNCIGFRVAMGKTLDEVRTVFIGYIVEAIGKNDKNQITYYTNMIGLLNWLTNHYTTNSWYTVGK
jgi:hypothetical protein